MYTTGYQGNFNPALAATIAVSTSDSSVINCAGFVLCGIQLPASFSGTALTFLASADGVTYQPLYSTTSGTALSYTCAQGHFVAIDSKDFYGVNYLQIVSNASETATRTLQCAMRGF